MNESQVRQIVREEMGKGEHKGTLPLAFIWRMRLKLRAEGAKLRAEGFKCYAEGEKLYVDGFRLPADDHKLPVEGEKLFAEGSKLWAEGDRLWAEAILEAYGNIKLEWKNWNEEHHSYECHLENGEVFGF